MSNSIFSCNASQKRWVDQLNDHFIVYFRNYPSIFKVPESLSATNPKAYVPKGIGLGPYHHFRPDLYKTESAKFEAIKLCLEQLNFKSLVVDRVRAPEPVPKGIGLGPYLDFLSDLYKTESAKFEAIKLCLEQLHNFKSLVVDRVRALEPAIRSCYDMYLDLDSETLAWAMAIDGAYLFLLLHGRHNQLADWMVGDVLMMENQLPCILLNQIRKALILPLHVEAAGAIPCNSEFTDDDDEIEFFEGGVNSDICEVEEIDMKETLLKMSNFCRLRSPLEIEWGTHHRIGFDSPHILDFMYRMVVYRLTHQTPRPPPPKLLQRVLEIRLEDVAAEMIGLKPLELMTNMLYPKGFNLFGNANISSNSSIEKIKIPSVSQLDQAAKIQFERSNGVIAVKTVEYDEETRTLYLPVIRVDTVSEVILRNLLAYESTLGLDDNKVSVSAFVDFMCGLIDTAEDVDLLKGKGILLPNGLPSEEVAKMFNRINKSSRKVDLLEEIIKKMNEAYDKAHIPFRVKCSRFLKNHLIPSLKYGKHLLFMVTILFFFMQVVCQIYGCSDHWFPTK